MSTNRVEGGIVGSVLCCGRSNGFSRHRDLGSKAEYTEEYGAQGRPLWFSRKAR